MADIGATPFVNYGLSQAEQGLATAQTGLVNQQTQSASMANQRAAMALQVLQSGMPQIMNFDGQNGGQSRTLPDISSTSNASGASPGGAAVGQNGAPPSGQVAGAANSQSDASGAVSPLEDVGQSAVDQGRIEAAIERRYNVDPAGTQAEQTAIHTAYIQAQRMKMVGDPSLSAYGDELVKSAVANRDMGVQSRLNASRLDASQHYDEAAAIESAPPGQALAMLAKLEAKTTGAGAEAAANIVASNPDASPEELDEITRDSVAHLGGWLHRFTGRETVIGDDGIPRDKDSGLPVSGVPPKGFSVQQISDMRKEGLEMTTTVVNGRETPVPKWQAAGFDNVDQYVQAGVSQAQSIQHGQQAVMALRAHIAAQPPAQTSPNAPTVLPGSPWDAQGRIQLPGAPPGGGAPQAGSPQQPSGSALTPDQVDFVRNGPRPPAFLNTGNAKPNPGDVENQQQYSKDRTALLKSASDDMNTAQASLTNISRIQSVLARNPTVGPGSAGAAEIKTALSNWLPTWMGGDFADAVDSSPALRQLLGKNLTSEQLNGMLEKFHGEGAQVRLGAQESKLIIGAMTANPELSKGAITQMLQWEQSDAQYSLGRAKAARAWVTSGRDVQQFDQAYSERFPKQNAVQTSLGVGGGAGVGATGPVRVSSPAQAAALASGTQFITPDGRVMVKR